MSSIKAVSLTVLLRTNSCNIPGHSSPMSGPRVTRPREGFSPTRPQALAGMRIEPPLSIPCAIGTIPAATLAPEPPLEPPQMVSVEWEMAETQVQKKKRRKHQLFAFEQVQEETAIQNAVEVSQALEELEKQGTRLDIQVCPKCKEP